MKAYRKGFRLEHAAKQLLEQEGYFVVRSAGSHSPCDLVALRHDGVLLVQVKASSLPPLQEREQLIAIADKVGAVPIAMFKRKRKWVMLNLREVKKSAQTS